MKNIKNVTFAIFMSIGALLLSALLFILGIILANYIDIPKIYIVTAIVNILFFVFIITNSIRSKHCEKEINNMKGQEIESSILGAKEEALKNIDEKYHKIINSYKIAFIESIIFYIFLAAILFLNGLSVNVYKSEDMDFFGVLYFITMIFILGISYSVILQLLLNKKKTLIAPPNKKKENKYPLSYNFIKSIFAEEGIEKEIEVNLIDDVNVGIIEEKDRIVISIGTFILKFFTKEEIKAIIYHEIAHYKHEDTKLTNQKNRYINLLNSLLPGNMYTLVCPRLTLISMENTILEQIITIAYETKADDELLERGVGDAYASSAVKLFGLSYAFRMPRYDIEYEIAKEHKWTDRIIEQYFNGYLDQYNKHKDFYLFASENHLEERISTHPNVKQRVEKFKTKEVNPDIIVSNEFDSDIKELYNKVNETKLKNEKVEAFDSFIKTYDDFTRRKEEAIKKNYEIPSDELQSIMDEAYSYGDTEFSKECAYKVLDNYKDNSRANIILGIILAFYDFDDKCIPHLQSVIKDKNSQFVTTAFDVLGEFVTISGKEELRDELRTQVASTYDNDKNINYVLNLNITDKLEPFTNQEVINNIIEIAKEESEIEEISIGTKRKDDSYCHHVLLFIKHRKVKNEESLKQARERIWAYLDLQEEQYNLIVIFSKNLSATHRFRRKPLRIYKR